jgi:hypothetical protein
MTDIATNLAGARTVLVCAPSLSGDEREVCSDLLLAGDPAETSVLWVTFRRDARACVDQWSAETDDRPRDAAVVAVGDTNEAVDVEWAAVETLPSASDLTGLGIEIGESLSAWDDDLAVCFDSLTAMLQYVELETAYEFIHTITGQFYAANARAHFHIDPTAHDPETVDNIASVFDAVVMLGDGDARIRKRRLLGQ